MGQVLRLPLWPGGVTCMTRPATHKVVRAFGCGFRIKRCFRCLCIHLRLQQLHILLLRRGWIANASWLAEPHRLLRRKSKKHRKADSTLGTPLADTAISTCPCGGYSNLQLTAVTSSSLDGATQSRCDANFIPPAARPWPLQAPAAQRHHHGPALGLFC